MNRVNLITLTLLASMTVSVQASTTRDVDDLVDMRVSSGERELEDRGYRHHKTIDIKNDSIGYWWNSRRDQCIAVTEEHGRFKSILEQPEVMCGRDDHYDDDDDRYRGDLDNISELKGMRTHSAENALEDAGYRHRKNLEVKNGDIDYWWNRHEHKCIAVNSKDGRVTLAMDQPDQMCD